MSRKVMIEVDSREKEPVLFPNHIVWAERPFKRTIIEIDAIRKQLPIGDYRLARYPRCGVVERKRDLTELAQNLLASDRRRFRDAWARFITGCEYPILLIESTFSSPKLRFSAPRITQEDVRSALYRLQLEAPNLLVIWSGGLRNTTARVRTGAELVRLLLTCSTLRR